jgi:glycosyltransferase involved in cell wall biosynthesis
LEAIFSGCKVVATDVGSVKTFLPEKYIIPNDSIENLQNYILKIINEKKYDIDKEKLKLKFTWSNVIDNYEKTYKNNLTKH